MTFLAPIAAIVAAAVAIPALLALYFLKRRRRIVQISSTFLWRKAINDLEVNAPFQRIRRNLLLILQLLILIAALIAFARPAMKQASGVDQRVVIVIDHSASMNAADESPTRLLAARERAKAVVDDLGDSPAMVISFAGSASVVEPFTTDRASLRRAIDSIPATDERSVIEPALRLIEPFALENPGKLRVYVFSDGRLHDGRGVSLRGVDLQYIRLGRRPNNLGIIALAARRDLDDPQLVRVLARLGGSVEQSVTANVTLKVNGQAHHVVRANVGPAAPASVQFELAAEQGAFLEVSHDYADDLIADNRGALVLSPPRKLRVMLISDAGNAQLARAIRAAGAAELFVQEPERYEQHADRPLDFDVLVFDRYAPRAAPRINSLYFAAAPPLQGLSLKIDQINGTGTFSPYGLLDWRRDHDLLRLVALEDLSLLAPARLALPDGATPLAATQFGPVIALVPQQSTRHVVVAFDVLKTDWPMRVSFPVFMFNALNWLATTAGSDSAFAFHPGESAAVPYDPAEPQVIYDGPEKIVSKAVGARVLLPAFTRAGIYYAQTRIDPPWDRLPVNLTDELESDLTPADRLPVGVDAAGPAAAESRIARRDLWPWFIWPALAILLLEWFIYTRRMHL